VERIGNHARVWEYDGAHKCMECHAQWGALPGHPQMPERCDEKPHEARTPRTDAALLDTKLKHNFPNASFVHADFARQLERELAAAIDRERLANMRADQAEEARDASDRSAPDAPGR